LVLVIGIVAALAVMAAALVVLVVNVQSNTARERTRTKAFNVAEGGLDAVQNLLYRRWPFDEARAWTETELDAELATYRASYDESEFPDPRVGEFISVTISDDVDPTKDYDTTGNGKMLIDSTARIGTVASRVQVMVQRVPMDLHLAANVALYTDGHLTLGGVGSGGGTYESPFDVQLPATGATVYAHDGYTLNGNIEFPTDKVDFDLGTGLTVNDVFPDDVRDALIELADAYGNRVDAGDVDGALIEKVFTEYPHILVVKSGSLKLTAADTWSPPAAGTDKWMFGPGPVEPMPGVVIVESGDIEFGGGGYFFGVVYCMGGLVDTGTTEIRGMVVALGDTKLNGNRNVVYDPNVLGSINNLVPAGVRTISNTWKELTPEQ
jgi:hypothetical protein